MSRLPRQLQKQLQQAEQALAPAPEQVTEPAPESEPPQEPEQVTAPPAETQAPPAEGGSTPPAEPRQEDPPELWEQRYRSLQGTHNRHMEDMKRRIAQAEQAQRDLERQLNEERERAEQAQAQAAGPSPEDAETFGSDLVDMVSRVAKAMVGVELAKLKSRLDALETGSKGAAETAQRAVEDTFLVRLAAQVPDYREVNADPKFLDWLAETDPVYGATRQAALDNAAGARDADRVAAIFNSYKALRAPGQDSASRGQKALEQQVSPSAGAAAPVRTPQEPTFVTQAAVQGFYRDVAMGKFRGRDEEMHRIEASINKALAENRIR